MTPSPSADEKRLAEIRAKFDRNLARGREQWPERKGYHTVEFLLRLLDASQARLAEALGDVESLKWAGDRVVAAEERASALAAALKEIAKVTYGLEINSSDAERAEVWSGHALRYQQIAREALSKAAVTASPASSEAPPAKPPS